MPCRHRLCRAQMISRRLRCCCCYYWCCCCCRCCCSCCCCCCPLSQTIVAASVATVAAVAAAVAAVSSVAAAVALQGKNAFVSFTHGSSFSSCLESCPASQSVMQLPRCSYAPCAARSFVCHLPNEFAVTPISPTRNRPAVASTQTRCNNNQSTTVARYGLINEVDIFPATKLLKFSQIPT